MFCPKLHETKKREPPAFCAFWDSHATKRNTKKGAHRALTASTKSLGGDGRWPCHFGLCQAVKTFEEQLTIERSTLIDPAGFWHTPSPCRHPLVCSVGWHRQKVLFDDFDVSHEWGSFMMFWETHEQRGCVLRQCPTYGEVCGQSRGVKSVGECEGWDLSKKR